MEHDRILASIGALALSGCYAYPAYPPVATSQTVPASFDTSWQAARGAANDQGVRVTYEDQASGTLRGEKGPLKVLVTVVSQADGTVRVGFSVSGPSPQNSGLQDELTRSYQRRMGR